MEIDEVLSSFIECSVDSECYASLPAVRNCLFTVYIRLGLPMHRDGRQSSVRGRVTLPLLSFGVDLSCHIMCSRELGAAVGKIEVGEDFEMYRRTGCHPSATSIKSLSLSSLGDHYLPPYPTLCSTRKQGTWQRTT